MNGALDIAMLGSSLRSAYDNGHAAIYCALVRALVARGHRVRFYERGVQGIAETEALPADIAACLTVYTSVDDLCDVYGADIAAADVAILGSSVEEGVRLGDWLLHSARGITAFYDLDMPATLVQLRGGVCGYLGAAQIPRFGLYLSTTGGPALQRMERDFGAHARPLYCAVDAQVAASAGTPREFDMGYAGAYSPDRQRLLSWYMLHLATAWPDGRFVVAGSKYPDGIAWPVNVGRVDHYAPARCHGFYTTLAFMLALAGSDSVAAGWSPGVQLFEAAACGVPVISNVWSGIDAFFQPGKEILLAEDPGQVLGWLLQMPETARWMLGASARRRVLAEHTAGHRVETLERYIDCMAPARASRHATPQTA